MWHPYVNLWWKEKNEEILNDPSSSVTEFSLEDETEQRSSKVIDDKSNEIIRNSKRSFRQDSYEITIHGHRRSNEVTLDSAVSTPLSVSASPMMKRNCWIIIHKNAHRPSDSSLYLFGWYLVFKIYWINNSFKSLFNHQKIHDLIYSDSLELRLNIFLQ